MRVMNTGAKCHLSKTLEKCLQEVEMENKKIYLKACLQQNLHLSHFFASIDGLLAVEAEATMKRIATHLAKKRRQP